MRLTALVRKGEAAIVGVGATEAARMLGMAPALAKEQLLAAESQGMLCLDATSIRKASEKGMEKVCSLSFCYNCLLNLHLGPFVQLKFFTLNLSWNLHS